MTVFFTAIGNACIDLVASVDDHFLTQHQIPKGLCRFINDFEILSTIKNQMGSYQPIPGGAGANVAHVISALGDTPRFISKIASDNEGLFFQKHMEESGVICHFPNPSKDIGSSQVLTLITPDGERTFLSFDDVATTFSSDDYDFNLLNKTNFLYLDGYCFVSPSTHQSFVKASLAVRNNGGHVTFNIGDIGYFTTKKEAVMDVMAVCDSIICNAEEARVMFGQQQDILSLAKHMSEQFLFGAVTDGKNGAHVFYQKNITHIPAEPISPEALVDTNGAGDHFSAGFIYGLMNKYSLEQAGRLGILCANNCISHSGARPLGGHGSLKHLAVQSRK